ncbi:MAG: NUDIX hydrolase [Methyloligellaceae bacterium]
MSHIRVKAMCVFCHKGKTLASCGEDQKTGEKFYRLLGGSVEFGESAEQAVRREMIEEIQSEISNLTFLTVVENIFEFEGIPGHEVVFIYKGDLVRSELYNLPVFPFDEGQTRQTAKWVNTDDIISGQSILYPSTDYSEIFT